MKLASKGFCYAREAGFTLIELMIVVTIVGVLATIAIPAYMDYSVRARMTEVIAASAWDKTVVTEFYSDRGRWPTDGDVELAKADFSEILEVDASLLDSPRSIHYEIRVGTTVHGILILEAVFVESVIYDWVCRSSDVLPIEGKYLPGACR